MEKAAILEMLFLYEQKFPLDISTTMKIRNILEGDSDPFSRKSFQGHITCGAVVMNPSGNILLVQHKILNKWLTPGGHVEPEDTALREAALRELEEETGVQRSCVTDIGNWLDNLPLHIDAHVIPENAAKQEPEHTHFDFRFLFMVPDISLCPQEEEVLAAEWSVIDHLEDVMQERIKLCVEVK